MNHLSVPIIPLTKDTYPPAPTGVGKALTVNADTLVNVIEVFESIQGEGLTQGQHALFIRFAGCNLRCSICDTKYTWDLKGDAESPVQTMPFGDLLMKASGVRRIVFTGGEPLLPANLAVIRAFLQTHPEKLYEIETNGTIPISTVELNAWAFKWNVLFNISPKGNIPQDAKFTPTFEQSIHLPPLIRNLVDVQYPRFIVKMLVKDEADLANAKNIEMGFHLQPHQIYIQPVGEDAETLLGTSRKFINTIVANKWNLSPRLHIFLWGKKRNV